MKKTDAFKHWHWQLDANNICRLTLDVAGKRANLLSKDVLLELDHVLDVMEENAPKGLVIASAKPSGFIAGADITEFSAIKDKETALQLIRRGQGVMDRIEKLPFPTLALIHGFCLGGGMELALSCRYRIADDAPETSLGLPEIHLGIHPGFGGTVRLTRLIGGPAALEIMLTGRPLTAQQAKKLGIIDFAVPNRQLENAATTTLLTLPRPHHVTLPQRIMNTSLVRPLVASLLRKKTAAKVAPSHYPAPFRLIDLWEKHGGDRREMMAAEAESVAKLMAGETARNLVRIFFLRERLKSLPHDTAFTPRHVHVVGGGVMGGDIAAWCALKGFDVSVQDVDHDALARVVSRAKKLFAKKLKKNNLVQGAMDRLFPDPKGIDVEKADVVIEAIFENVAAKQSLFRELEQRVRPDTLLATNTSSIPLQVIGEQLERPKRLVGLHFFNPVAKMQLVEVVRTDSTDPAMFEKAVAFTLLLKRLPLPVQSAPGFLVNRILMPYLLEAVLLEEEGVPAAVIDRAATAFGMPIGPIELADTVGLDICRSVAELLKGDHGPPVPARLTSLLAAGRKGRKSGHGFYRYKNNKPEKPKPADSYQPPADLTDRMVMRLLNEVMACLREKIVADADLLDAGMVFGTGFAPFRGGPAKYIRDTGEKGLSDTLRTLADRHGDRFTPDPGWDQGLL